MCEAEGMSLAPWGALCRGHFRTDEQLEETKGQSRQMGGPSEEQRAVSAALNKIAKAKNVGITGVALRYVMHKSPYVFPIRQHEALRIELTDEEVDEMDKAVPFDIGFPLSMLLEMGGEQYDSRMSSKDIKLLNTNTHINMVQGTKAPAPRQGIAQPV
ncbi:MAG: hypothetical protein Q9210_003823 [Variospora velana]